MLQINYIICNTVEQAWFGTFDQALLLDLGYIVNQSISVLNLIEDSTSRHFASKWYTGERTNNQFSWRKSTFQHFLKKVGGVSYWTLISGDFLAHFGISSLPIGRSICWLQGDSVFLSHTEPSKSHAVACYCWRTEDSPTLSAQAGGLQQVCLAFIQSTTREKDVKGQEMFLTLQV